MRSPIICLERRKPGWTLCWRGNGRCDARKYLATDSTRISRIDLKSASSIVGWVSARLYSSGGRYDSVLACVFSAVSWFWVRHVFFAFDSCLCPQQAGYDCDCAAEFFSGLDDDRMGGRVGLGGEDGRSCGGAVSFFTVSRRFGRTGLVSALIVSFGLACSQRNAPPPPDAAILLQAVAAADP